MHDHFDSSSAAVIMTLLNALLEIGTIAKEADKHATCETEYSGAITPQAFAFIELRAIEVIKQASAMLEDDIRSIEAAEMLTSTPMLNAGPPVIPKLSDIPVESLLALSIFPTTTGKIKLTVENGVIRGSAPIPADHLDCSIDTFIEIAKRCGDGFQAITVPTKFTGQILVTAENGEVVHQQELSSNHVVTTLGDIAEVAQQVGIITKKPDTMQ